MFGSSLPLVVCRSAHVWCTLCLLANSGVQYILCCVFALFFFVLCTICCQFLSIVHFLIAHSVFSSVYENYHDIFVLGYNATWDWFVHRYSAHNRNNSHDSKLESKTKPECVDQNKSWNKGTNTMHNQQHYNHKGKTNHNNIKGNNSKSRKIREWNQLIQNGHKNTWESFSISWE